MHHVDVALKVDGPMLLISRNKDITRTFFTSPLQPITSGTNSGGQPRHRVECRIVKAEITHGQRRDIRMSSRPE